MLSELESAAHRYAGYAKEVIAPAVFGARADLDVAMHQCPDPIPLAAALAASYEPAPLGWRWGPAWSTAWFRLRGRVPETSGEVALRFSCGTEALLWRDGRPTQGFDVNRDTHVIAGAKPGDDVDLLIEAACNRPLGITAFWWDPPGTQERWASDLPGILERAELAAYDAGVWRLWRTYEFVQQLAAGLPADTPRGHALFDALRRATQRLDDRNVTEGAADATAILTAALAASGADGASRCFAVGHAHIDTAWLWPIRETRRKCLRSFATVLRLMERYPDFRFLCSQPQQYAWVEEDAPALFGEIAGRVREGRWEAAGAMWIEPDCNVPSGEALLRQVIYGVQYWREKFGDAAPQDILYLPDTFGFPASLPTIMAAAGLDTFITNKLSWNERNEFPLVSFRWRGLDGSEVLAHCTPGHDYNAANTAAELRRGAANEARKDRGRTGVWLQPFGYGDGGGGPTAAMIERAHLAAGAEGLPRVTLDGARAFRAALHEARERLQTRGDDLPAWDGELYLELHRGTYTTQAWLKAANRRAELGLRRAEWLGAGSPAPLPVARRAELVAELREAWRLVLLNQFHDILPGSSIAAVYDDARSQYARIRSIHELGVEDGLGHWATQADATGLAKPMIVFNPGSHPRTGVVAVDGADHSVADVPALGVAIVDRAAPPAVAPVGVHGRTLANGVIEATIDEAGCIASLRRARDGREAAAGPLNRLVLYEDRPRAWEAWDIDAEHADKPDFVTGRAERIDIVQAGPLRASIEVERPLGAASRIVQRYVLTAGSPRLDIETSVDWRERRRLLRALFPVAVRATRATYEIQFGHVERATHRNTAREQAMFEVCAHTWADLSEPGFGVALLNDGKYGHSCEENVLGLSLLRGPAFPDADADRGLHAFTYALMPHDGDWRAAGVDRAASDLNDPLIARGLLPGQAGPIDTAWAPFTLSGEVAAGVVVSAFKPAEDGDGVVLRLVETHGRRGALEVAWHLPMTGVDAVDALERPCDGTVTHDGARATTIVAIGPFRIVTLRCRRARDP